MTRLMGRLIRKVRSRRGQAITEYAILAGIIGIASIVTVSLLGMSVNNVLNQLGKTVNDDKVNPDLTKGKTATAMLEADAEILRHMGNFDTAKPGGGENGGVIPVEPSKPPIASDPLAYAALHHVGDNWVGVGANWGGAGDWQPGQMLVNEGLSYDISFFVTQDMVDYANYASDGNMFLTFDAGGTIHGYVHNEMANGVTVNGNELGFVKNGNNTMVFNTDMLSVGDNTLSFESGMLKTEYDDYDFWNMNIGYE